MFDSLYLALTKLADPNYFWYMLIGVGLGTIIGIIPGIGGGVLLAILMPIAIVARTPEYILATAIGGLAITCTSDSISAILLGVPGTTGGVATIIDGYAMAKKGEAARALCVSFISSIVGGVLGGLAIIALIPIVRPIIMAFGSPQMLMLCVMGIACVGLLSGRAPLKGLTAGFFGLLLAFVGDSPHSGLVHRLGFSIPYLWAGIPLVPAVLGLYALPEVFDLIGEHRTTANRMNVGKGWLQGFKDYRDNWWLSIKSAAIGGIVGFVPGIGLSVAQWLSYVYAVQSSKIKSNFGKGDVRGVIAPETANNACRGGELIPTIFFGVPGSGGMAILLVMMLIVGISPGPGMLREQLHITLLIALSLIVANIIGGLICFFLARPLSYVTLIPSSLMALLVLMVCLAAAWQTNQDWGDIWVFFTLGMVGWGMKHTGFSRPATIIGLVLGTIIERYLTITLTGFGWRFLLDPWVIIIAILIATIIFTTIRIQRQQYQSEKTSETETGTASAKA